MFCAGLSLPIITNVTVGPALVVLRIVRCPSATTIRKLGKNKGLLLTRPGNYTIHLGPHSVVEVEHIGQGFCCYWP